MRIVQNIYEENIKTFSKNTKKYLESKWKNIPFAWIG